MSFHLKRGAVCMNFGLNRVALFLLFAFFFILGLWFFLLEEGIRVRKRPQFAIQDITYPTEIDGVWYFNRRDERNLILKYPFTPWEWAPTPDGFELSPQDADFIYSSVLRKAGHFGNSESYIIYFDTNFYFFADEIMHNQEAFSLLLLENTIQINGRNGQVFNPMSNAWENMGYVHITYQEAVEKLKIGEARSKVIETVGSAFETIPSFHPLLYTKHMTTPSNTESLEYWCKSGNFIVVLTNGYIMSVVTNVPFKRL